ncbi:MAG: site-specific integrase [Methylococcaceae bacterium]|nr:site-specific integrase [Methylococcaceae bacterium]
MTATPHKKIRSLDELLTVLQVPKTPPLRGFLGRCFMRLFVEAGSLLNLVIDIQAISPEIERLALLDQDITSAIFGNHELTGVLNKYYLYAMFTSTANTEEEPESLFVIRALLLVVLCCPNVNLSANTIKVLSSITRNHRNYGSNTDLFFESFPKYYDPKNIKRSWERYLQSPHDFPDSWVTALIQLLGRFTDAYRWLISNSSSKSAQGKQIRTIKVNPGPLHGLLNSPDGIDVIPLGTDFLTGDLPTDGLDDELPLVDAVDTTTLVSSPPVPALEEPPLPVVERARTFISEQISYQDFLAFSDRVLVASEFEESLCRLRDDFRQALKLRDLAGIEANVMLQLTAVTGWSLSTLYYLNDLDQLDGERLLADAYIEGLSIKRGLVLFRIPDVDKFWKPRNTSDLFVQTSERIQLLLPLTTVAALRILRRQQKNMGVSGNRVFSLALERLQLKMLEIRRSLRSTVGLKRFSVGRLRRFLPVQLFQQTHDTALVMLACGQTHGFSTAPLHYYQTTQNHIQQTYEQALRGLFSGHKKRSRRQRFSLPEVVGSRLQLPDQEIGAFVLDLIKPLRAHPADLRGQINQLNQLSRYAAWMLLASTGHRNTQALGKLTTKDLYHEGGMALFSDKVVDAGHRARLVVLPQTLCRQIQIYLEVCQGLSRRLQSEQSNTNPVTGSVQTNLRLAQNLQDAVFGNTSLFIQISKRFICAPITNQDLSLDLPPHWQCKLNFFRHRLATRLRNNGVFAEYVNHQLGHLDSGMQPFGRHSLLNPSEFVASLQPYLDQLLEQDSWKLMKTRLPRDSAINPGWRLSFDYRDQHRALLHEEQSYWRGQLKRRIQLKRVASPDIEREIDYALSTLCPGYHADHPPHNIELSDQQLKEIQLQLLEAVTDQADQLEWRNALLRRRLLRHRSEHQWQTPLPGKVFRVMVQPSPFVPGSLAAYRDYQKLREWLLTDFPSYQNCLASFKGQIDFSTYYLIRLVMALILTCGYFGSGAINGGHWWLA